MHLTKSDFTIARTCATKLYYKKLGYPSLADEDPYLEFLTDGGYMVETMAKLLFADGKELGNSEKPDLAFEETTRALDAGNGTFFEATVAHKNLLARIDILRREADTLRLIEVKASSIDSSEDGPNPFRGKKGGISSEWRPYLEDVTFQVIVLSRAFPHLKIAPFLCVVDKAKSATANVTFDKFRIHRLRGVSGRRSPEVVYTGNIAELQRDHVLVFVDVSLEVQDLRTEVEKAADAFAAALKTDPILRITPEVGKKCKNCEYRMPQRHPLKSGFRECWRALADPDPHILDLYRVDLLGGKNHDIVAELAAKGLARLSDVPTDLLSGAYAPRQRLQIECTAMRREYIDPHLTSLLATNPYPLHFIDFEGSRLAIPYHSGMRPYELASFQWSCHTIRNPGAKVEHSEWLNDRDAFPNFDFAKTLKTQIGNVGTVYIWSPYEVATLREIREQITKYGPENSDLAAWIDEFTTSANPRIVDLCALARDYYFHPSMKGYLSIKHVFPAAWEADANLRTNPLFSKYARHNDFGSLLNPYATLPPLPIGGKEEVVKEGTGAMRIYQEMMFGGAKGDEIARGTYRRLLLQYCELDTAAMVAIWMHWIMAGD